MKERNLNIKLEVKSFMNADKTVTPEEIYYYMKNVSVFDDVSIDEIKDAITNNIEIDNYVDIFPFITSEEIKEYLRTYRNQTKCAECGNKST